MGRNEDGWVIRADLECHFLGVWLLVSYYVELPNIADTQPFGGSKMAIS